MEQIKHYKMSLKLKAYRPTRKPITTPLDPGASEVELRKRRLIVRDWFFYVIWAIRVKNIAKKKKDKKYKGNAVSK